MANKVCQYMHSPIDIYWLVINHTLCYLYDTSSFCLHLNYQSDLSLDEFNDFKWISSVDNREFKSGYIIFLRQNLISYKCSKQCIIAWSLTKVGFGCQDTSPTSLVGCGCFTFFFNIFSQRSNCFLANLIIAEKNHCENTKKKNPLRLILI
jgi:hypothetical protein